MNNVLIRWIKKVPPYNVGETCGVPAPVAAAKVKQKLAVYADGRNVEAPQAQEEEVAAVKKRLKVKKGTSKKSGVSKNAKDSKESDE